MSRTSNTKNTMVSQLRDAIFSQERFNSLLEWIAGKSDFTDEETDLLQRRFGRSLSHIRLVAFLKANIDRVFDEDEVANYMNIPDYELTVIMDQLEADRIIENKDDICDLGPGVKALFTDFNANVNKTATTTSYRSEKEFLERIFESQALRLGNLGISLDGLRTEFVSLASNNSCFQFARGLVHLDKLIESTEAFKTLIILAKQFYLNGMEPDRLNSSDGMDELLKKGIIKSQTVSTNDEDDNFTGYFLSPDTCRELFRGHPELIRKDFCDCVEYVGSDSISQRALFFDKANDESINMLRAVFSPEKYDGIVERMKAKGKNASITILLHGAPGTGKTELVKQMCRETGRDVLIASPEKLNNRFVGASEKAYKKMFQQYSYYAALSQNCPVLVLDECDSILGKRLSEVNNSCDILHNTIQAMILEELSSNFCGILCATTNLATSLDSAFERRFLFKLEFHKPSVNTRKKIIRSMMPGLSAKTVNVMASEYDFSGGQIDNISKKVDMYEIVYGVTPSSDKVIGFCKQEVIAPAQQPKHNTSIKGFNAY